MRRREFIAGLGGAAAWPVAARAQQAERMRRIGFMNDGPLDHPNTKAPLATFRKALSDLGWIEGRNLRIDFRAYTGESDPLARNAALSRDAAELVALAPDVVVTNGGLVTQQLLAVTRTVPIVFNHVNDPVARGFVASLARPGGNATGFTHLEYQMSAKWLELLKQIAPHLAQVAVMGGNFGGIDGGSQLKAIQAVAPSLGIELSPLEVRNAAEIERGIAAFAQGSNDGLIVTENVGTHRHHELIVMLAARHRLPSMYFQRYFVAEGGLISYAPSDSVQWRSASGYVDRILKGEKPADLPVQQPTKFELVINMKTAKALGITIPPSLLATADEVIE